MSNSAPVTVLPFLAAATQASLATGYVIERLTHIGPANDNLTGGRVLSPNASLATLYIADPQFEYLGRRGFTHNPLIKWLIEPADRNVILTQTAALWVDELIRLEKLRHEKEERETQRKRHLAIEVKGDVADTPLVKEIKRLETIIRRHGIPVEGYTRGNHSSGNIFGVFNLSSPWYDRLLHSRWLSFFRFYLDEQLEGAFEKTEEVLNQKESDGGFTKKTGEILNQQATMDAMHDIVTCYREDHPKPKTLTTAVHAADYQGYQLLQGDSDVRVLFTPGNLDRNFQTFWKPSKGTVMGLTRETRFWECVVNYDIADDKQSLRATDVNPIYLQASETVRFRAADGTEYPVYTISLDGLDHKNLLAAVGGGVSDFQVRLIETFMERMLQENPRARFKISSHFSAEELVSVPWYMPWRARRHKKAREAFRKILAREEVILFSYGHTHRREVNDLNKSLKLGRKTALTEINVPSLIDYHPNKHRHNGEYHDARALVVERLRLEEDGKNGRRLVIDLEYRGLDEKGMTDGKTPEVEKAVNEFSAEHGYNRARETRRTLRNKHIIGWGYSHLKRAVEFVRRLIPHPWLETKAYWKDLSLAQYVIDNFTVVSTVNMFNEARHLIPFLESVAKFIGKDEEPGQLAVRAQLLGLRTALIDNAYVMQDSFEKALASGARPSELKRYNDLFLKARTYRLADLLLSLRPGSPARAFAILASIRASREEFQKRRFIFFKTKPTDVPNQLPSIVIPLPEAPSLSASGGAAGVD